MSQERGEKKIAFNQTKEKKITQDRFDSKKDNIFYQEKRLNVSGFIAIKKWPSREKKVAVSKSRI